MALAVFQVETPDDCCLLCYHLCPLFAALPCSLPSRWYPPCSASLRRLRHPMFEVVLFCDFLFCLIIWGGGSPSVSAFPWDLDSCRHCPPAGHRNTGGFFVFVPPCLCPLPFSSPAFGLFLSCRFLVGALPGHTIGLIVPTNSNVVPSGHGLRPERMMILISFSPSFLSIIFFLCVSFFSFFCPSL